MIVNSRIMTYTGAVNDYTLDNEALSIYTKETVTDSVGYFTVILPAFKGVCTGPSSNITYNDIALHDRVDIYLSDKTGALPGTPTFSGMVGKITSNISEDGCIREFSGLSRGEILLRRFKTDTLYDDVDSDDVALDVVNDLSLGNALGVQTDNVTVDVETMSYFDLLREVSDYWVNGGTQIKQDFYVEPNFDLKWDTRPFRSGASVETLTYGQDFTTYSLIKDADPVRNSITVYGAKERTEPAGSDDWCEATTNWTANTGVMSTDAGIKRMGTVAVKCNNAAGGTVDFYRTFDPLRNYGKLVFWYHASAGGATLENLVAIRAPDATDYFEATILPWVQGAWQRVELSLGADNVYDADVNPSGEWTIHGAPRWYNMRGLWFKFQMAASPTWMNIDGATCFTLGRYASSASNGGSIASYGQRDLTVIDDKLHSDSECQQRAETLLYQLMDPPSQLQVVTSGNTNILPGDRLPMTLPIEEMSAADYDVLAVEHFFRNSGFTTKTTMANSANVRAENQTTPAKALASLKRQVNKLAAGYYRVR